MIVIDKRVSFPVFRILAILATVAFMGIVVTQVYYASGMVEVQKQQFDNKVRLALKGVVNQLRDYRNSEAMDTLPMSVVTDAEFLQMISSDMLYDILRGELKSMGVDGEFTYGVFNSETDDFVILGIGSDRVVLKQSEHVIGLTCIYRNDQFLLKVAFDRGVMAYFQGLIFWFLMSFVMILLGAVAFMISLKMLRRQKEVAQFKTDLLNNMTHEFKTPLAAIHLAGEMMNQPVVVGNEEKYAQYLKMILAENNRMQQMVDKMLQVAAIEQMGLVIEERNVDMHDVITAAVEPLRLIAQKRKGEIIMLLEATQYVVKGDRQYLRGMVNNLLDNALKYSLCHPEVEVKSWNTSQGFFFSVRDKGVGIAKNEQNKVFDKMYRVSTGNLHNVKGIGFGLYYIRKIVEGHGGEIQLKSDKKTGSLFTVFLPLKNE